MNMLKQTLLYFVVPILEIARVRQELVKKHGGIDGYFRHIQKLDRAHRKKRRKAGKQKAKTTS